MMDIQRSKDRGFGSYGWLETHHSFSFAYYYNPERMGFRSLRVLNDDVVAPGEGFPLHPHRDAEIVSYIVRGGLDHRDTTGHRVVLRRGDVQRVSAGRGISHSEMNASRDESVRFVQIWFIPDELDIEPSYDHRRFPIDAAPGRFHLIVSSDGREGSLSVHQDVSLYAAVLPRGESITHTLAPGRHAWIQIVEGSIEVEGEVLEHGDGVSLSDVERLRIEGRQDAELLLIDLA